MSHNTDAVVAGLSFLGQLDRIREMPLASDAPPAAPEQPKADLSLDDARQPASLSERVKQAFAAHHLPIHNKKDIPFTTIKVACPGAHPLVRFSLQGLHRRLGLDVEVHISDESLEAEPEHGFRGMIPE